MSYIKSRKDDSDNNEKNGFSEDVTLIPKQNDAVKKIVKKYKEDTDSKLSEHEKNIKTFVELEGGKLLKNIEGKQINIIEVISIFIALFTFISIEINIFRLPLNLLSLIGFTFILLGSLSFFVVLLIKALRKDKESEISNLESLYLVLFIFLVMGTGLIYYGNKAEKNYIMIENDMDRKKYILIDSESKDYYTQNLKNEIASSSDKNKIELENLKNCLKKNRYLAQECLN